MRRVPSRGRSGARVIVFLALLAPFGAPYAAPARADMFLPDPPRTKRVPVTMTLDWGVFADRVPTPYTVKAGDTLHRIAAAACGDAARWKAVADANRDVVATPDRLAVGVVLWLPPARAFDPAPPAAAPTSTSLEPWYDAYWATGVSRYRIGPGERAAPTDRPAPPSGSLFLVPHADVAALDAARAKGPVAADHPTLARTLVAHFGTSNLLPADDPTKRIELRYRLTGRDGAAFEMTTDERRLDAAGALVPSRPPVDAASGVLADTPHFDMAPPLHPMPDAPADVVDASADDGRRWPTWIGLLVAAVGGALVGGFAVARRRHAPRA